MEKKESQESKESFGFLERPKGYIESLQSDFIQGYLKKKTIPTPFLATCIETGIVDVNDETLLFEIEKSCGQRLHPMHRPTTDLSRQPAPSGVSSTAGMPTVNTGRDPDYNLPPFLRDLPTLEMYQKTVEEMDRAMENSEILKHKYFVSSICHNARKVWCTPALMRTLVADRSYADKLRAAMYPATMSFCCRTFEDSKGRMYTVPYITILEEKGYSSKSKVLKRGDDEDDFSYNGRFKTSTTFYLHNRGGIGAMASSYLRLYDPADFASPEAVGKYLKWLEKTYEKKWTGCAADAKREYKNDLKQIRDFLTPYATGKQPIDDPLSLMKKFRKFHKGLLGADTENDFTNLKEGKTFYASIRNNIKEIRRYGEDWYKCLDVTGAMRDGVVQPALIKDEFERQRPGSVAEDKRKADACLLRLHQRMMKTEGLLDKGEGYTDPEGEEEYLKNDLVL